MDHATAAFLSAADIKAFGPAPDGKTLEALLRRLADIALDNGNPCLWGWMLTLADMPEGIADEYVVFLGEVRDKIGRSDLYAVGILDAAISVLRRP